MIRRSPGTVSTLRPLNVTAESTQDTISVCVRAKDLRDLRTGSTLSQTRGRKSRDIPSLHDPIWEFASITRMACP